MRRAPAQMWPFPARMLQSRFGCGHSRRGCGPVRPGADIVQSRGLVTDESEFDDGTGKHCESEQDATAQWVEWCGSFHELIYRRYAPRAVPADSPRALGLSVLAPVGQKPLAEGSRCVSALFLEQRSKALLLCRRRPFRYRPKPSTEAHAHARAHCGLTRTAPLGCADAAPVPPQVCSEYPCAVSTSWLRHAVGGGVGNNILPAIPELHAILTSPTGPSLPPPHQLPRTFLPPAIPSHAALAQRAAPCRGTTRRRHMPSQAPTGRGAVEWLAVAAGGCAAVGALQSTLGKDYVLHAHRRGPRAAHAPAGPRVAQRALRGCGWRGYRRRGAGGCTTRRRSRRIRAAGSTGTRTRTGRTGGCGTTSRGGRCSSALLATPTLSSCSFALRRARIGCTAVCHSPNRRWGLAVLLSTIRRGRCSSAAAAVRTRALWRARATVRKQTEDLAVLTLALCAVGCRLFGHVPTAP